MLSFWLLLVMSVVCARHVFFLLLLFLLLFSPIVLRKSKKLWLVCRKDGSATINQMQMPFNIKMQNNNASARKSAPHLHLKWWIIKGSGEQMNISMSTWSLEMELNCVISFFHPLRPPPTHTHTHAQKHCSEEGLWRIGRSSFLGLFIQPVWAVWVPKVVSLQRAHFNGRHADTTVDQFCNSWAQHLLSS